MRLDGIWWSGGAMMRLAEARFRRGLVRMPAHPQQAAAGSGAMAN